MTTGPASSSVPTETPAPASKKSLPLGALLVANLVATSLVLVAVIGFGGYVIAKDLDGRGPSKHVEAKASAQNGVVTAHLVSTVLTDRAELSNPGVTKTWTLEAPYGTAVTLTVQTLASGGVQGQGGCSLTVNGVPVDTKPSSTGTGLAVCSWVNDGKS